MKIGVIDTETTHLKPQFGSVVEIGIVELDSDNGNIVEIFDAIVQGSIFCSNPDLHKNAWVFKNTSLKYDDVCSSYNVKKYRDELQEIFDRLPMTAFNRDFDIGFMKSEGFKFMELMPCIMLSAQPILKLPGKYGNYKYPSAQEAWNYFFPDNLYKETHRALDDAHHEAQILYEMIKRNQYSLIG